MQITGLNLKSPRKSVEKDVLKALMDPKNNGDSHIKLLLTYPDKYAIDVETVKLFLNAFYSILWADNEYSAKLAVAFHKEFFLAN